MKLEEAIKQCEELINSDIVETRHCSRCEHDYTNECVEEGCLYNIAIEIVLKELKKVRCGRNFLSEYILAKEFTPEMLRKCLYDYVSKDKIREKLKKYEENQIKCKKENGFYSEYLAVQITTLEELLNESEG